MASTVNLFFLLCKMSKREPPSRYSVIMTRLFPFVQLPIHNITSQLLETNTVSGGTIRMTKHAQYANFSFEFINYFLVDFLVFKLLDCDCTTSPSSFVYHTK